MKQKVEWIVTRHGNQVAIFYPDNLPRKIVETLRVFKEEGTIKIGNVTVDNSCAVRSDLIPPNSSHLFGPETTWDAIRKKNSRNSGTDVYYPLKTTKTTVDNITLTLPPRVEWIVTQHGNQVAIFHPDKIPRKIAAKFRVFKGEGTIKVGNVTVDNSCAVRSDLIPPNSLHLFGPETTWDAIRKKNSRNSGTDVYYRLKTTKITVDNITLTLPPRIGLTKNPTDPINVAVYGKEISPQLNEKILDQLIKEEHETQSYGSYSQNVSKRAIRLNPNLKGGGIMIKIQTIIESALGQKSTLLNTTVTSDPPLQNSTLPTQKTQESRRSDSSSQGQLSSVAPPSPSNPLLQEPTQENLENRRSDSSSQGQPPSVAPPLPSNPLLQEPTQENLENRRSDSSSQDQPPSVAPSSQTTTQPQHPFLNEPLTEVPPQPGKRKNPEHPSQREVQNKKPCGSPKLPNQKNLKETHRNGRE